MEYTKAIDQHLASMCGVPTEIKVTKVEEIQDGALMATFEFDGHEQTAIYYPQDDMLFTPTDWQGSRPRSAEEIDKYGWMDSAGDEAIVMGGLPRVFTAIRDDYRKGFGRKVRAAREDLGMTQSDLAQRAGLKQANVSRIESGRYSLTLDTIARLTAVLGELA